MSDWLSRLNKKPSPTESRAAAPEPKKDEEPPFYVEKVAEIEIGLIATFGIKEGEEGSDEFRADIRSLAERFNEMNSKPAELVFSRKGE